jgi:hypothetical protein
MISKFSALIVLLGGLLIILQPSVAATVTPVSKVVISEIKLGGGDEPKEFITLFNQSESIVSLESWTLEYAKTTFDKTFCSSASWLVHNKSGSASETKLTGSLLPGQVSSPIERSLTDNVAGSVHLVDNTVKDQPVVQDIVGWGVLAPCHENEATLQPTAGKSIQRYLDCETGYPIDTNSNAYDFAMNGMPVAGVLTNIYKEACETSADTAEPPLPPAQDISSCRGIAISELLPNPAGADGGHEFIELHNPSNTSLSLKGCFLQTSASNKVYPFADIEMSPDEYLAISDTESGLILANSAGGTVWLLDDTAELQAIAYPAGLEDDQAWAYLAEGWQATYQSTPNIANSLLVLKPCPAGQERSVDTGQCRVVAVVAVASLATCKTGQERNPETNRCRAIAASSSASLTPCKTGQERSPETNRCRSITGDEAVLQPCEDGQERNPETNRCRKVASVAGSATSDVKDVYSGSIGANPRWWMAGAAILAALGYGIYEWRQELLGIVGKARSKLFIKN